MRLHWPQSRKTNRFDDDHPDHLSLFFPALTAWRSVVKCILVILEDLRLCRWSCTACLFIAYDDCFYYPFVDPSINNDDHDHDHDRTRRTMHH